jgi:hypothetical protein
MGGTNLTILSRQLFDFSQLTAGNQSQRLMAKQIHVLPYREAVLIVRYHPGQSSLNLGTGQSIVVACYLEAPSVDEPTLEFWTVNSSAIASITINSSTLTNPAAPALYTASLNTNFGSHLRFYVTGTQGSSSGAALKAMLSVDLPAKM